MQALKAEEERRGKLEREAQRRRRREERWQRRKQRDGGGSSGRDRREIVFESGHREVWIVAGSEEWYKLRRGRGGGGEGVGGEDEGVVKKEPVSEDSYSEPEEEVSLCSRPPVL